MPRLLLNRICSFRKSEVCKELNPGNVEANHAFVAADNASVLPHITNVMDNNVSALPYIINVMADNASVSPYIINVMANNASVSPYIINVMGSYASAPTTLAM